MVWRREDGGLALHFEPHQLIDHILLRTSYSAHRRFWIEWFAGAPDIPLLVGMAAYWAKSPDAIILAVQKLARLEGPKQREKAAEAVREFGRALEKVMKMGTELMERFGGEAAWIGSEFSGKVENVCEEEGIVYINCDDVGEDSIETAEAYVRKKLDKKCRMYLRDLSDWVPKMVGWRA